MLLQRQPEQLGARAQVLAFHAARERLVLHPLHDGGRLEVEHALARTNERRGGNEAGHLVAGEQRLLERALARHTAVVGVRENGLDHPLRVSLLAQDLAAPERMILEARPPFVIEIVQQRDNAPRLLVLSECAGIASYGRLDGERVLEEALAL